MLRSVPGVVEVNTWGGDQRVLEVKVDPVRMAARGLTLEDVRDGAREGHRDRPRRLAPGRLGADPAARRGAAQDRRRPGLRAGLPARLRREPGAPLRRGRDLHGLLHPHRRGHRERQGRDRLRHGADAPGRERPRRHAAPEEADGRGAQGRPRGRLRRRGLRPQQARRGHARRPSSRTCSRAACSSSPSSSSCWAAGGPGCSWPPPSPSPCWAPPPPWWPSTSPATSCRSAPSTSASSSTAPW